MYIPNYTPEKNHGKIKEDRFYIGLLDCLWDISSYPVVDALRVGDFRSLRRVPPTISYCEESSP